MRSINRITCPGRALKLNEADAYDAYNETPESKLDDIVITRNGSNCATGL
jgi:hypothetical protein